MAYQPRDGDIIALDNPKAGSLVLSTSLADYSATSTDPVTMFARRDAFRTVAEAIASSMANVPINLYERDEANGRQKLTVDEDPVAAALEAPTAGLTQYRWVEALQLDHVIHDRWACLVLRNDDGTLEFVRLPARWIAFALDPLRRITHVALYRNADRMAEPLLIPIDQVLFDVGYDPAPSGTTTQGFSIARTLETSAMELERGAAFRAQVLANGPKVPMYITRPANAPEWVKNGGRDRFLQTFKGFSSERAGETPLMEDGMELKDAPQLEPDKIAYNEARVAAQIEFAIAMHYPPELVGYREGNFSNIAELREHLYVDVLGGRLAAFRQALNAGMRRAGILAPKRYLEENVAVRLQGNPELQASVIQTQVGAPVRTVNEARRLLNLKPVPGGDDLIVPLNVTKGGLASPTDTAPKALSLLPAPQHRSLGAGQPRLRTNDALVQATLASPGFMFKAAASEEENAVALTERALHDFFRKQQDRVTKALGSGDRPLALDVSFDVLEENTSLYNLIYRHSYQLATIGADRVLDVWNVDRAGFSYEMMLPWLQKASTNQADMINRATYDALADKLFTEQAWPDAVEQLFESVAGPGAGKYARMISTVGLNFGAQDAAGVSRLNQKRWIHRASKDARPTHEAMDGIVIETQETFPIGARWPGETSLPNVEWFNCHCRVEYFRSEQS
jgi:HK97 family phage portal protein